ncbi:MAG TPA: DNA polymerase III subunit [Rubrobacter sp.]|nr:DNA polymerase III subunit [Rubrobacter sp.]
MAEAVTFEGILGNEAAVRLLENALKTGQVAHAYLFFGPAGVGKRTVARRFGAALVAGGDPAAEDRARRGLHPDLAEIRPEGAFTTIGQVREILRLASGRPFEGARRVFILEADTLNVQAANALLKTLEEPEGESVFVLLAGSREGVLPTILSRAQAVRFNPVPMAEVEGFLRGRGVEEPALAAALGRGSVGLALRYAEDPELKELRGAVFGAGFSIVEDFEGRHGAVEEIVGRAEALGAAREKEVLDAAEEPDRRAKDGAKRAGRAARDAAVREAIDLLALMYRDVAAVAVGAEELVANADRVEELRARADEHPGADWAGAALALGEARLALAYNVSPEAILEVALSRIRRNILEPFRGSSTSASRAGA